MIKRVLLSLIFVAAFARAGRHFDVRIVELDFNPVFARQRATEVTGFPLSITLGGQTAKNFNVGAGVVIH